MKEHLLRDVALRWARQTAAREALGRALSILNGAGIDALPVKGIVTTPLLYDRVTERDIADVDLRIRPRDRRRAMQAFAEAGFPILHASKQWGTFETLIDHILVECETSVGPPGLCGLTVDTMIAHGAPSTTAVPHIEPELHEHVLLLCVNVFKDKLARARSHALEDLARIVTIDAFDARRFARLVHEAHSTTLVWLVADFMVRRGANTWAGIRDQLGPPRRCYATTYTRLRTPVARSEFLLAAVARMGSDDAGDRARALAFGAAGTFTWWLRRKQAVWANAR